MIGGHGASLNNNGGVQEYRSTEVKVRTGLGLNYVR